MSVSEVCFRSYRFRSFGSVASVLLAGPKEPKGQGRVKIYGREHGGSTRRTGNSPSGLRHPGAVPRSRHRSLPIFTMRPPSGYNLCSTIPSLFFPFLFSLFSFCLFVSPSYYNYHLFDFYHVYCRDAPRRVRINLQMKKSHADFADTQIYRGLMGRISEKVSQITRITQIAIRGEYVESILSVINFNLL